MNHIYKSIWNASLGVWVAVSELAKTSASCVMNSRALRRNHALYHDAKKISSFKYTPLSFLSLFALPLFGATYTVDQAGNWATQGMTPELTSFAYALQNASSGQSLLFSNSVNLNGAANWVQDSGTLVKTFASNASLSFELSGNTLSATNLRFITGTGIYSFLGGTVSATTLWLGDASTASKNAKLTFGAGSTLQATTLNLAGAGSVLTTQNGSQTQIGTLNITDSLYTQNTGATAQMGVINVTSGGVLDLNGANTVSGFITVEGVKIAGFGPYSYTSSELKGTGSLTGTTSFAFKNGGKGSLTSLLGSAYTIGSGQRFLVDGVFEDAVGKAATQTSVLVNTALTADGTGTLSVTNGGKLSGVQNLLAHNGGTVLIEGVKQSTVTGAPINFRSEIIANGSLSVGGGAGTSLVKISDGGKLSGITDIEIGKTGQGKLEITGLNATANLVSELTATGNLSLGDTAKGTLILDKGGKLSGLQSIVLKNADLQVKGFTTQTRSILQAASLAFEGTNTQNEAALSVQNGALFSLSGEAKIGTMAGNDTKINLGGFGGAQATFEATLKTGFLTLGEWGNTTLDIANGGSLRSASAVLAKEAGSVTNVTINAGRAHSQDRAWEVLGTAADFTGYAKGNTHFTLNNGLVDIAGILAMGGQDATSGQALIAGASSELHMRGGTFRNQGAADETGTTGNAFGTTKIQTGALLSGYGKLEAGDQIIIENATIAAGGRWMYDVDKSAAAKDKLTGLGTLTLEDQAKDTLFKGATFRTELDHDRGSANQTSDRVEVNGNLKIEDNFVVNMSRVLNGNYTLVKTNSGTISGYNGEKLWELAANPLNINLNGKTLKGSRVDVANAVYTTLEENDTEIHLKIDNTKAGVNTFGNVYTHWTGANASGTWDMVTDNFQSDTSKHAGTNTQKFLDGDIVVFDSSKVGAGTRVVNVTNNAAYVGIDPTYGANVVVAEVQVIGDAADANPIFEWRGGSIIAKDSALYTTLDQMTAGQETPSGKFIKKGSGALSIYNVNEFYGGVHLYGGTVNIFNNKAFGTYNSESGLLHRGVIYVHEDARLNLADGVVLGNRFVVAPRQTLDISFVGTFTIQNNNAMFDKEANQGGVNGGKGGGVYIGSEGNIVYTGSDTLFVKKNQAQYGGGFYAEQGYTLKVPLAVSENYASKQGGGIYSLETFALKDASSIKGNATQGAGGGIYVGYKGDGVFTHEFILHGNTEVSGNLAGGKQGGGAFIEGGRILGLQTAKGSDAQASFEGGDIWFFGNLAGAKFDKDDPTNLAKIDKTEAKKNAVHLAWNAVANQGAVLNVSGPYNTYFYDPVSGDAGTKITVTGIAATADNNSHNLSASQTGTVTFRDDSEFYGNTDISGEATFRLEEAGAIYGRKGSTATSAAKNNTFDLKAGSTLSGQGKIAADSILLSGILELDTATFSRPDTKNGSGTLSAANTQGTLALEGALSVANTALWKLNLTAGAQKNDVINVTGTTTFTGATAGQKATFNIDNLLRGSYALLTSTGGITGFNTNTTLSDAQVFWNANNINLAQRQLSGDAVVTELSRIRANSWSASNNLNLSLLGRNRHVHSSGGDWGYINTWTFDANYTPTGTSAGLWTKNDSGAETLVYLDGDMVTLKGGAYTLSSAVQPVDVFVTGNVDTSISGNYGITTSTASTITTTAANNDYGIAALTNKLYKYDGATLTFTNTQTNTFGGGIEIGTAGADGGTIAFSNGNQLGIGSGKLISFVGSGTLNNTAATTVAGNISINAAKTATIDTAQNLSLNGMIANAGQLIHTNTGSLTLAGAVSGTGQLKNSAGTLILNGTNTYTGGTAWEGGALTIGNAKALSSYATAGGTAGKVTVSGTDANTFTTNGTYAIQNHFDFLTGAGAATFALGANTLTIDNVNVGSQNGGALSFASGSGAFSTTGTGALVFSNNKAAQGGAIYSASDATITLDATTTRFTSNAATAGSGGAVYAKNVSLVNTQASELVMSGNSATDKGGAFFISNSGALSLAANAGNLKFSGNSAAGGGSAIWLDSTASVSFAGAKDFVFADSLGSAGSNTLTKTGVGTLAFTNALNNFSGTSTITTGDFRVTQNANFGSAGTGTFALASGASLSGGGTIKAGSFDVKGLIEIDKSTVTTKGGVLAADKIGQLTLEGTTTILGQGTTASVSFDLNKTGTPNLLEKGEADFLKINGSLAFDTTQGKVVFNINNFKAGHYKLIEAQNELAADWGFVDANHLPSFQVLVHSVSKTNRHLVQILRGDQWISDGVSNAMQIPGGTSKELWLGAAYNNLAMTWTGKEDATWQTTQTETKGNWLDKARSSGEAEEHVENRDSVIFQDAAVFTETPVNKSITLGSNVLISNMKVDTATGYSFGGAYSIRSDAAFAGEILAAPSFFNGSIAPQKLEKLGAGTLAFTNVSAEGNLFAGGIDFRAGTISFTLANQLATGTSDIRFLDNATLQANANSQSLSNAITLSDAKTATINTQAHTLTLSGKIADTAGGAGNLTKTGAGTLILTNTMNDWSGATNLSQGLIEAQGVQSLGENVTGHSLAIANGARLRLQNTANETFNQTLSGAGVFEKTSAGTLTLAGTNTAQTGGMQVSAGRLIASTQNNLGTGTLTLLTGSVLETAFAGSGALSQYITGAGALEKSGAGTLTLSNNTSNYTGGTLVSGGAFKITHQNAAGTGTMNLGSGTVFEIALSTAGSFSQMISGAGAFTKSGADLTLSGNNTYAGGTNVASGKLTLGSDTALGTGALTLQAGTTLASGLGVRSTTNAISALDNATLSGVGTNWILGGSAAADRSSVQIASGKTLTIDTGVGDITFTQNLGGNSRALALGDNAVLRFTGAKHTFIHDVISGNSGSKLVLAKTQVGEQYGMVQIAKSAAFAGDIEVRSGSALRLVDDAVFGSGSGTFTLDNGASLQGKGTLKADTMAISGNISTDRSILRSGNLSIPNEASERTATMTLSGNAITLEKTATVDYMMGQSIPRGTNTEGFTGTTGDLLKFSGNGTYTLKEGARINFIGTLHSGRYLVMQADRDFVLDASGGTGDGTLDGIGGEPGVLKSNLGLDSGTPRGELIFDWGKNAVGDDIHSQIWLNSTHNSLKMQWQQTGDATWQSLGGAEDWKSTQFNPPSGGNPSNVYEKRFANGDYVAFATAGDRTITLESHGVTVSGMDFSSAGTTIFAGTGGILGEAHSASGKFVDNSTLTGTGTLTKSGTGTLVFANTGSNNFEGGIFLAGGTLAFGNTSQIGTMKNGEDQGLHFTDNATLRDEGQTASTTLSKWITIADGKTATFGVTDAAHSLLLASKLSGTASLAKNGAGTLTLTNTANDFSGMVTILEGVLQADGVLTLGRGSGVAITNGKLVLQNASSETLSKTLSGAGVFEKIGAGTLTLTGSNTHTGGTQLSSGRLVAGAANNLGSGLLTIGANSVLETAFANDGTVFQKVTGAGTLEKTSAGVLTLSNETSDYAGGTSVLGGQLKITHQNAAGSSTISLGNNTVFEIGLVSAGTFHQSISGAGAFIKSGADLRLSGDNTFTGGATLSAGKLILGSDTALGLYASGTNAGTLLMKSGTVLDSGADERSLQNRIRLENGATGTIIANGKLTLSGIHANDAFGAVTVGDNASLNLQATSGDFVFTNNMSGAGKNDLLLGAGSSLTLSGSHHFFFDGGIKSGGAFHQSGTGFSQFSTDSSFNALTLAAGSTLRLVDQKNIDGSNSDFSLGTGAKIAGEGTFSAKNLTISGGLSPDNAKLSSGLTSILEEKKFGALTLSASNKITLNDFSMQYDIGDAWASKTYTGDLLGKKTDILFLKSTQAVDLSSGKIHFQGSFASGNYLVVASDQKINLGNGKVLDGTSAVNGVLKATYNGVDLDTTDNTPREFRYHFEWDDDTAQKQIWMNINRHSLTMDWEGGNNSIWSISSGWKSVQDLSGVKETTFNNGDYVNFKDAGSIEVLDKMMVSGQKVSVAENGDTTFTGAGGIYATTRGQDKPIEGKYLNESHQWVDGTDPNYKIFDDARLVKEGAGTLTFANTGGNNFEGGIFIHEGTIAFNDGAQLNTFKGTTSQGIHFENDGTLRATATLTSALASDIVIAGGKTATFDTKDHRLTLTGSIKSATASETANIIKTGAGELVLKGRNDWGGTTKLDEGKLTLDSGFLNGTVIGKQNAGTTFSVVNGGVFTGVIDPTDVVLDKGTWNVVGTGIANLVDNLQNDGDLRFVSHTGFTTLKVNQRLSGTGHLYMNTNLAAAKSDLIETAETGGTMTLHVTNSGGAPAAAGGSVKLIDVTDASHSNATFTLNGGQVDAGAYRYSLQKGVNGQEAEDWFLFNTGVLSNFAHQTLAMASSAKYATVAALNDIHKRLGELHLDNKAGNDLWTRSFHKDYDNHLNPDAKGKQRVSGFDIGYDRRFEAASGTWYLGALAGAGQSDFKGELQSGQMNSSHAQAGLYGSFAGNNGFYLDLVGRYFWFSRDFVFEPKNALSEKGSARNTAWSLDAEAGYRIDLSQGWFVEPQAEITWLKSSAMHFTTDQNTKVAFSEGDHLMMRTGLAFGRTVKDGENRLQFFGRLDHENTLSSKSDVTVNQTRISTPKESSSWIGALGLEVKRNNTQFHFEVEAGLGKADIKQNWGVNAGVRMAF